MSEFEKSFYITLFLIFTLNLFSCKKLGKNIISFTDDEEITTITSDSEKEFLEAIDELNKNGGTIYIDTPVITLKYTSNVELTGNLPGGIIGLRQAEGEYPRINFQADIDFIGGFNIYGSNKFIEYIIVENVQDNGISLIGDNNILDHVVSRYNFGPGFAIYGDFNTLNYCYSYRNCDARKYILNADGFYIVGEVNNIFNYCFAWDNANTGFNYARTLNSSELSYLHSGSWNNGNINVFTGRYDYDNGSPLDKNLWTIQEIMESDPNFASNYYNKKFSIDDAYLRGKSVKEWMAQVSPQMNGNGFTFGNKNSSQSIDVKRNALYCISFNHKAGGFVDNFNHRYNGYFTNCAAFSNNLNYILPYTFTKWENMWTWDSRNGDRLNKVTAKQPINANTIQNLVYNVANQINRAVYANMFPDGINFDIALNGLR